MRSLSLLLGLMLCSPALAVPTQLHHQGRIMDLTGLPLDGAHVVNVALYDGATSSVLLWSDDLTTLFDNGYFSLTLGSNTPLEDSMLAGDSVWLSVGIDGAGAIGDRIQVVSVPFARIAGVASSVDGGVVNASEIRVNGSVVIDSSGTLQAPVAGDTLGALSCIDGELPLFSGGSWSCASPPQPYTDADAINAVGPHYTDTDAISAIGPHYTDADVVDGPLQLHPSTTLGGATISTGAHYSDADALALIGPHTTTLAWTDITNRPAGLDDGDDDTIPSWSTLAGVPGDFADDVDDDTLGALICADGEAPVSSGGVWGCAAVLTTAGGVINGDLGVVGSVQVGDTSTSCTATSEGTLRWASTSGRLEVCTGAGWIALYSSWPGNGSVNTPGASCKQINTDYPGGVSGPYWIDVNGAPFGDAFEVYCDMVTDGGGWTLLGTVSGSDANSFNTQVGAWGDTSTLGDANSPWADLKSEAWNSLDISGAEILFQRRYAGAIQGQSKLANACVFGKTNFRDLFSTWDTSLRCGVSNITTLATSNTGVSGASYAEGASSGLGGSGTNGFCWNGGDNANNTFLGHAGWNQIYSPPDCVANGHLGYIAVWQNGSSQYTNADITGTNWLGGTTYASTDISFFAR